MAERAHAEETAHQLNMALGMYIDEQNARAWVPKDRMKGNDSFEVDLWFVWFMEEYAADFPATLLEDGCDTPWARNKTTLNEYLNGRGRGAW